MAMSTCLVCPWQRQNDCHHPLYKLLVSKILLLLNIPSMFIKHIAQFRIFLSHLRPLQCFHFRPTTETVKKIYLSSRGAWLAQSVGHVTPGGLAVVGTSSMLSVEIT